MTCYRRVLKSIPNHPEAQRNMKRLKSYAKHSTSGDSKEAIRAAIDEDDPALLLGMDDDALFSSVLDLLSDGQLIPVANSR